MNDSFVSLYFEQKIFEIFTILINCDGTNIYFQNKIYLNNSSDELTMLKKKNYKKNLQQKKQIIIFALLYKYVFKFHNITKM